MYWEISLMVQWLRHHASNAGSVSDWGNRSYLPQLKIPHATVKTWCSQINKNILKLKKNSNIIKNNNCVLSNLYMPARYWEISEDLYLEVKRSNSILRNSVFLYSLLNRPQHFWRYLTKNWKKYQVDRKNCFFHGRLWGKSTIKISGKSYTITFRGI